MGVFEGVGLGSAVPEFAVVQVVLLVNFPPTYMPSSPDAKV